MNYDVGNEFEGGKRGSTSSNGFDDCGSEGYKKACYREEQYTSGSADTMHVGSASRFVTSRSAGDYTFESTGDYDGERAEREAQEDHVLSSQKDINLAVKSPSLFPCLPIHECDIRSWIVFRLLVPEDSDDIMIRREVDCLKKNGKVWIEFFEGPPRTIWRAVMVASEEVTFSASPEVLLDCVLQVHQRLVEASVEDSSLVKVSAKLLIFETEAEHLIFNQNIKSIADAYNCSIKISTSGKQPTIVILEDMVIEVEGLSSYVHVALRQILSDLGQCSTYSTDVIDAMLGNMRKPPYKGRVNGISVHGRVSVEVASSVNYSPPVFPCITNYEVLSIPLSYADYVIGEDGEFINGVLRPTGATINVIDYGEILDDDEEISVEISGNRSDVETAVNKTLEMLKAKGMDEADVVNMKRSRSCCLR